MFRGYPYRMRPFHMLRHWRHHHHWHRMYRQRSCCCLPFFALMMLPFVLLFAWGVMHIL